MTNVLCEYLKLHNEYAAKYGGRVAVLFQVGHPVYKSYSACTDGSVYNEHGRKMAVSARLKSIQLYVDGINVSILHRLFVWHFFYGSVPSGYQVYYDECADGNFCDRLVLYRSKYQFDAITRDKLRERMRVAGYKVHPQYKNYMANMSGHVYSLYTRQILVTQPNGYGYIQLSMLEDGNKTTRYQHVIVWESCTGKVVPPGYQIDHIDQDKSNNSYNNLNCLTIKEHMLKTHNENPQMTKSFSSILCRRVVRIGIGNNDSYIKYPSRKAAAESIMENARSVSYAIASNSPYNGYMWYDCTTDDGDLDYEEWTGLYDQEKLALCVSNLGRIYGSNKRKTMGFFTPSRYMFTYKNRGYGVHEFVCLAFHGRKPSSLHTVDHIDRNPHNNACHNLRWATKHEQAKNRTSVRAVEGYTKYITIGIWPTIKDASDATGACRSHITSVIKGNRKSAGKTSCGQPIAWRSAVQNE